MTILLLIKSNIKLNLSDACAKLLYALDLRVRKIQGQVIQGLSCFNEFDEGAF